MDNSPSTVSPPAPDQITSASASSLQPLSESTSLEPTTSTTTSPTPASSSSSMKILKTAAKGAKQQQRQPSPSSSNSFSAMGSTGMKNQTQGQSQVQRRMILQNSVSAPTVGSSSSSTNGSTTPASTTAESQPALSRVSSSSSASAASSSVGGSNSHAGGDTQVDPQILEALKSKDRLYVLKLGEIMEGLIKEGRWVLFSSAIRAFFFACLPSTVFLRKLSLAPFPARHASYLVLGSCWFLRSCIPTSSFLHKFLRTSPRMLTTFLSLSQYQGQSRVDAFNIVSASPRSSMLRVLQTHARKRHRK